MYILEKLSFIARVSTGVSTGQTFCVSIRFIFEIYRALSE